MNKDQKNEIETALDGVDIALDTIRGAMLDLQREKANIYDILNGATREELFELDRDADARELFVR